MQLKFHIYFCDELGEKFFGEGPYRLLLGIQELGSLRAAALQMGMAYTKAFALIKRAEQEFGFPLTQKTIGGKGGGGSVLTMEARELLQRYNAYRFACAEAVRALYQAHFADFPAENHPNLRQEKGE